MDIGKQLEQATLNGRTLHAPAARFGDLFHEIPEPEVFYLPCGAEVRSYCRVDSLGQRWTLDIIPRQPVLDALERQCVSSDLGFSFQVLEHAGTGQALVLADYDRIVSSIWLALIDIDSVPGP